jgi:hypothetical protein
VIRNQLLILWYEIAVIAAHRCRCSSRSFHDERQTERSFRRRRCGLRAHLLVIIIIGPSTGPGATVNSWHGLLRTFPVGTSSAPMGGQSKNDKGYDRQRKYLCPLFSLDAASLSCARN